MDCQIGSRRCATWDEIEDAPQIKRLRENKEQQSDTQQHVPQPPVQQDTLTPATQQNAPVTPNETPKFYISAPIQGYTVDNTGGCRYVFY
ncbi:unnamed protein product [Caenorhabditis brenneri]